MSGAGAVCVVSPHLLVAQAVAAALASVGTPAEAREWDDLLPRRARTARRGSALDLVVAVTDGLDNSEVLSGVEDLLITTDIRVLVITSEEGAVRWGGMLDRDAVEVMTSTASVVDLARAAAAIAAGDTAMNPERRRALRATWARTVDRRRELEIRLASLSPQQFRVLELLASGRRVSEVGAALGVSSGTVRSHVKSLRARLGVRSQLKAVATYQQIHGRGAAAPMVPRPRNGSVAFGRGARAVEVSEADPGLGRVGPAVRIVRLPP